jgi:hypothetical protein
MAFYLERKTSNQVWQRFCQFVKLTRQGSNLLDDIAVADCSDSLAREIKLDGEVGLTADAGKGSLKK